MRSCGGPAALVLVFCIGGLAAGQSPPRPTIELTADNTVISKSCRVVIPPGTVIKDADGNGVIQIGAPNIEIEFAEGSVLRGSPADTRPDGYRGYGIRLNGHSGVTIRGLRVSGFWCGLWATKADGLVVEGADASDNRRAYLKSTPVAEDGGDWLFGHDNDKHQWLTNYAAAIYIEESAGVTVRESRVWHGQNALCLDRVTGSKIYDNDFSFNSGWGIALWRCTRNVISRNAVDFCVRGYSHGVYNRGQDSAGIFAFEQNNENVFAENSVTHGGDGFFGFAGREALGETGAHPVAWYKRRGNTDNLLVGNDFSYAPAHGIENTFSFGNKYVKNRIVGNAICGVWAGYSRETLIAGNDFQGNGEMGYGLERGGVNIDHGGDNQILHNTFTKNKCGVHLWGGANPEFEKKNWAKANGYASTGSVLAGNTFLGDDLAFHFRGPGDVTIGPNKLADVGREMIGEPNYKVTRNEKLSVAPLKIPEYQAFGKKHPVGARPELRGRQNIIMTEWGPWDHVTPLVRLVRSAGGSAVYQVLKAPSADVRVEIAGDGVRGVLVPSPGKTDESQVTVSALKPGVRPYALKVAAAGKPLAEIQGTLLAAQWQTTFFQWPEDVDPRKNLEGYRKLAQGPTAVSAQVDELSFKYGMRGPSDLGISEKVTAAKLGSDHFGMVARTRLPLTKGTWEFTTLSDDGVRVSVDGKPVIDNWTWHVPTRDTGKLTLEADKTVEIVVKHFEIDGFAVLEFSLRRAAEPATAVSAIKGAKVAAKPGAEWIPAGKNTNRPMWGIRGGLTWGLPADADRSDGPRGLIRLRSPVLPNGEYDLINFIAIEPIVRGHRGFSELEHSKLDGVQGKRLWALTPGAAAKGAGNLPAGELKRLGSGEESLTVGVGLERFDNGAHVSLTVTQRSSAPDQIELTIHAEPDSAPLEYCILTATMGNKARARQLWLKDKVVSSLELYPDYRAPDFAPHRLFPLEKLYRTSAGDVLAAITTNESDPAKVVPFPGLPDWRYAGVPVTQYWKKNAGTWREDLHVAVNGRSTYWMSRQPIPGGVAFENFEMRERFHEGQNFVFGITRKKPGEFGFKTPGAAERKSNAQPLPAK